MKGDPYCFWHSPQTAERRRQAGRKGGSKGKLQVKGVDIQSVEDVRRVLSEALSELRASPSENVSTKARAIGYLCSIALVALEKGNLEERIARLEDLVCKSRETA